MSVQTKKRPTKKKVINENFEGSLILKSLPGAFLISCLIIVFSALIYILWPLLTPIFMAAVLVIAFYPSYRGLLKFFRGRGRLASFVSCLMVVLMIIIPVSLFIILLFSEAFDAYKTIDSRVLSGDFDAYLQWSEGGIVYEWVNNFKDQISPVFDISKLDFKQNIIDIVDYLSSSLLAFTGVFAEKFSGFILGIFVMFFSMYYFFKDGEKLVEKVGYISPLPSFYEKELFTKLSSMVKAIVFGVFFTAILQGVVGGIGFAIVGISSPVFWGAAMAFLSLLPLIGTAIIWVPAVIILLIMGNYWSALFLFLWGTLLIGSVDNIARTYLIGARAKTYPLLTFFVILGGVLTMSLKGVVVGPLILMLLMSFLHIYEAEYSKVLKK